MRKAVLLAASVALVVAACSGDPVVARVNDAQVTMSQVTDLQPSTEATIPTDQFSLLLRDVILQVMVSQAAEAQFGITRDEEAVEEGYQGIRSQIEVESGATYEEFLETQNRTDHAIREISYQRVLRDDIIEALLAQQPELSDEEFQALYDEQILSLANVCARHILLETEEEAVGALDRLAGGEDFAELAMELSTGPSGPDGGSLGCNAPSGYVAEFATATMEAEIGQPHGPVETGFGFHVILVDSRTVPTLEEAKPLLDGSNDGRQLFNDWVFAVLTEAEVEIEARYGTWSIDPNPEVIPLS